MFLKTTEIEIFEHLRIVHDTRNNAVPHNILFV